MKILLITIAAFFFSYFPIFSFPFAGGTGTYDDPFQITTPEQLDSVRHYCGKEHADKHFLLMNEIDLDVPPYNQGEGWKPIGGYGSDVNIVYSTFFYGKFYGYMDGKCGGGIIKNLKLGNVPNDAITSMSGLFGMLGEGALIKNIGLENYQIDSKEHMVGPIVATSFYDGRIENCYTVGTISSNSNTVSGIAGGSTFITIKNCYSVCNLENSNVIGGSISGITVDNNYDGTVANCYSLSNLTAYDANIGMILSISSDDTKLSNCVAAGSISTAGEAHRVVGLNNDNAKLSNNYALNTTTINGNTVSGGKTDNANGGDATLEQLQSQSFYENVLTWDFDSIWTMPESKNGVTQGFPVFQWQYKKELRVILDNHLMEFDFGEISVGQTVEKSAEIKNSGGLSANLVIPPFNNSDFTFVAANNTINSNEIYNYKVKFSPTKAGEFADTIKINAEPCNVEYTIIVKGKALEKPPIKFTILASNHPQVSANRRNYRIPFYIKSNQNVTDFVIKKLTVEFDKSMFFPKRIENNLNNNENNLTMNLNFFDNIIEATFENIKIPELLANEEQLLLTVRGDMLLNDKDSSKITTKEVVFSEELFIEKPELIDGFITFDICRENDDRFLSNFGYVPSLTVKKNPVTEILEVECKVIERGDYNLGIVDLLGNFVILNEWKVDIRGRKTFNFEIPVTSYNNGTYTIIMQTPTAKYSTKFVINN